MRLLSIALLIALVVPVAALAQAPKEVVVINDPLMVEVVNPPAPAATARFQLVGFTSATYTGDMGGPFGVTRKCQLEFPNSRMCSVEEARKTTTLPENLSGTAWIDNFVEFNGELDGNQSCSSWISSTNEPPPGGTVVDFKGVAARIFDGCSVTRAVACCAPVP